MRTGIAGQRTGRRLAVESCRDQAEVSLDVDAGAVPATASEIEEGAPADRRPVGPQVERTDLARFGRRIAGFDDVERLVVRRDLQAARAPDVWRREDARNLARPVDAIERRSCRAGSSTTVRPEARARDEHDPLAGWQGWITAEWGTSEANRKARFYSLTKAGRMQVELERSKWKRLSAGVNLVLART